MISTLTLKFGRAPRLQPEPIPVTLVTVFVGPNNSGKSKALAEIQQYCASGQKDATAVILDDLTFTGLPAGEVQRAIEQIRLVPNPGEAQNVGHVFVGTRGQRQQVPLQDLTRYMEDPSANLAAFCRWFLSYNTLMLDGRSRIGLVEPQAAGDLQRPAHSSLQVLFRDDVKRKEVRRIVAEAFGTHFVLDPTNLGHLRIRLSTQPPETDLEERGIHDDAVQFHAKAQLIETASDGVKAFTGTITELIAGDPRIVLIDEPEAFLHPSLAFKLGHDMSRAALTSAKRIFASTHSPTFVMGCIQSGAPITIVRLTYRGGIATARALPSAEILELMRNPLLRSTGVLSGLFYEFVVVTESDADRAFYQEINERLLRFKPEWGIPNCLFINAQNKQTIQTIIRPLRKLGIPAVGIVDVDVLKEGGTVWAKLLSGAYIPELQHNSLATLRAAVKSAADATGRDMKRDGGISILGEGDQAAARNLLNQLDDYGIFTVRGGELESWVKLLGATGHGPTWLIDVFECMGEDPDAVNYLKPSDDDVWLFLSTVKRWLTNPARDGIPT